MNSSSLSMRRLDTAIPTCFWLTVLLSPMVLLTSYWIESWREEQYRHVPIILVIAALVLVYRWNHVLRLPSNPVSIGFLIGAVSSLVLGALLWQTWLGALSLAMSWFSFCWGHFQKDGSKLLVYSWLGILVFHLPEWAETPIQKNGSYLVLQASNYILDQLGVANDFASDGLMITSGVIADSQLALSSYSFFVFLAICWLVCVRKNGWLIPFYVIAACVAAFAAKLLWMVTTAKLIDTSAGETLPVSVKLIIEAAALIVGLLLLVSLDRLLQILFHPIQDEIPSRKTFNPLVDAWDWITKPPSIEGRQQKENLLSSVISKPSRGIMVLSFAMALLMALTLVPQAWNAWKRWGKIDERAGHEMNSTQAVDAVTGVTAVIDRMSNRICNIGLIDELPDDQNFSAEGVS